MSMNNNLEVRVSELTDVIKGLSDKPLVSSSDLNNVLNNFVKRVEDSNEEGMSKLTEEVSASLIGALENKYKDIQERLSLFENFVASVEKTVQNSKTDSEITRILNDIEALHSKMNSQEIQTESLIKAFDSVKNSTSAGQVSKLCDEIVSISKSYDGIVEVLNNNFQEFLRRVEATGSREDLQRLRYFLESLENNQNVLVSAMNAVNDKQEEIKNLVKQSSASYNSERFEYIQNAVNQLNKAIIDTTTKADLEILADKIASVGELVNEFKRQYTDDNSNDIKNVFQGQLNNIISKLESLKLDNSSNVNEDIIRLYTSIAEFKDGVYSAINTQLNDVIASMDVQFDKISNSVVNATLDNNEAINNLTGEVQKAQSIMQEGLNDRFLSIREEIQKQNRENAITVVNSLKGELETLKEGLYSLNNNDGIQNLVNAIDGLKSGLDIDALLIQIDQIKSALDFTPIREQIELLNKDETVNLINQKIDRLIEISNNDRILNKLEEVSAVLNPDNLYAALNSINDKIDFTPLDDKLNLIKDYLAGDGLENKIANINEKLSLIENIGEELVSVKNIDYAFGELKASIDEMVSFYNQKHTEDKNAQDDIKEALKTIYETIQDEHKLDEIKGLITSVKDNIGINQGSDAEIQNIEAAVSNLSSNIDSIQDVKASIEELVRLYNERQAKDGQNESDLKEGLKTLYDLVQNDDKLNEIKDLIGSVREEINSNNSSDVNFQKLQEAFISVNDNIDNINNKIEEVKNENSISIQRILESINENIDLLRQNNQNSNNFDFNSELYDVANSIRDDMSSQNSRLTGSVIELQAEIKDVQNGVKEDLNTFSTYIQNKIDSLDEAFSNSVAEISERLGFLSSNTENENKNDVDELKEQIATIGDLIRKISETPMTEQLNSLEQSILSANIDNANITKELVQDIQTSILASINSVKESTVSNERQNSFNETVIPLFDEFETRLNEKIVSLETLIEETGKTGYNGIQEALLNEIRQTKVEIQNQTKIITDGASEAQRTLLAELIKTQLNEIQLDSVNYLKQENEILTSFITENLELQTKEVVSKFAQIINAKENSEARINLIKSVTGNITAILDNSQYLKNEFEGFNSQFEEVAAASKSVSGLVDELANKLGLDIDKISSNLDDKFDSLDSKIKQVLDENNASLMEKLTSIVDFTNEISSKLANSANKSDLSIEFSINSINENIKTIEEKLAALIAENANAVDERLNSINDSFEILKEKVENSIEGNNNSAEVVQNAINVNFEEIKSDIKNTAENNKQELINSIQTVKDEINSTIPAFQGAIANETVDIKEKCAKLIEDINVIKETLEASISRSDLNLKDYFDDTQRSVNSIQAFVESLRQKSEDEKEEIENLVQEIRTETIETRTDVENKIHQFIEKISEDAAQKETLNINDLNELKNALISAFENLSSSKNEILYNELKTLFGEEKVEDIKNSIVFALNNSADTRKSSIMEKIEENTNNIHENIDDTKKQISSIKENIISSIADKEGLIQSSVSELKNDVQSIKNEINNNAQGLVEQLKGEMEELKASITSKINKSDNAENIIDSLLNSFEEKMQEKVSVLEGVIDNSLSSLDEKTIEAINRTNEDYKKALDNRVDFIVEKLQADYEDKLTDIQKLIDNRIYEIINHNNEIIKDELKLRADSTLRDISKEFKDKISKIESVLVKDEDNEQEGEKQSYTLVDLESDIAKIRLGIEKNNKLTNFKEFASRLVELKNINLENAKISRVIGADIMRFDSWLKNTTAKIDVLAAKIEKSEKIKMEDLKSRLIQSEKNQAMPQKLEEAIMTIYKKYRVQETKIEDMINKVEALSQKQTDTFDIKEFIDLFYDNTKKQDSLISRMDGIEDKMDYMQAKIDHIISSCIDE